MLEIDRAQRGTGAAGGHPVLTAWLVLALLTSWPYVAAALHPPPGRTFAGTFHYIDDFYRYASFVQQAEDGRFVFSNKLLLEPQPPALVNAAWSVIGGLSRLCGRRPFLAFRLFGLVVLAAFLRRVHHVLQRGGLPESHRLPALLLVGTGGGLGGLLFALTPREAFRCADLSVGVFPFFEILSNPAWLTGTWLLLETLVALEDAHDVASGWRAVALGSLLGLVRPYDFVLAALVHAASVPFSAPSREWARRLLPLAGWLPVAAYNYWVLFGIPTFASFREPYLMAPASDFLWAYLPLGLVAAATFRRSAGVERRPYMTRMVAWLAVVTVAIVVRPVSFSQQFMIGSGLPLLLLASLGVSRWPPRVLGGLTAVSCSSAVVALRIVLGPDPNWFVAQERREVAVALRSSCRPGDLALAPADVGLFAMGLTACRAFVSHPGEPAHVEREHLVRAFYSTMSAEQRTALLDRFDVAELVLPGDQGATPTAWLGAGTRFRRMGVVGGGRTPVISHYARLR